MTEDHSIGLVAAAYGNAWKSLRLEVAAGRLLSLDRVSLLPEVTHTAESEKGTHVRFSLVEQFKGRGENGLIFCVFADFKRDHVHALKCRAQYPEPKPLG